ncbi:MAG: hypothetical protein RL235_244 [Chlamydiota bacterium]|jgi:uncharacterized membrane protein YvlD (DUF360 family)
MNYLKSLFFNFLAVFFANHILPGVDVVHQTKLPYIGGDLLFAAALGFLNSLIYPVLKLIKQVAITRMIVFALVLNLTAYALLKIVSLGIDVQTLQGYLMAAGFVSLCAILTNYLEMRHAKTHHPTPLDDNNDDQIIS